MSELVSVDDELPEVMDNFIGYDSDGGIYQCCMWCDGEIVPTYMIGKFGTKAKPKDNITNWMPLPEPPK